MSGGDVAEAMARLKRYSPWPYVQYQADLDIVANERAEMLADAKLIVDAFAAGLFVRSTKHDHNPTWAMKLARPLSALARFAVLTDPTKEA